jgi:hypothetical protein
VWRSARCGAAAPHPSRRSGDQGRSLQLPAPLDIRSSSPPHRCAHQQPAASVPRSNPRQQHTAATHARRTPQQSMPDVPRSNPRQQHTAATHARRTPQQPTQNVCSGNRPGRRCTSPPLLLQQPSPRVAALRDPHRSLHHALPTHRQAGPRSVEQPSGLNRASMLQSSTYRGRHRNGPPAYMPRYQTTPTGSDAIVAPPPVSKASIRTRH